MPDRNPTVGSISTGTLKTDDLIITFADELERFEPNHDLVKEAAAVQTLWAAGWNDIYEHDMAADLLDSLEEALNAIAPPYCYFGTLEGDGSDFGFWPIMKQIEELPRVADPADVPDGGTGEDVLYVNDHGNVTVYGADGSIVLELV